MLSTLPWNSRYLKRIETLENSLHEINELKTPMEMKLNAIYRSMAVIEFDLSGNILSANENFLQVLGYRLDEILGKHHRMFVRPEDLRSAEYGQFWNRLRSGECFTAEFPRVTKQGKEIWIQATYNPMRDEEGTVVGVIKFASDITESKMQRIALTGKLDAVDRYFAVIEFNLDGTVTRANENFLRAMGYSASEIIGRHHRIFVTEEYRNSREYTEFWDALCRGQHHAGEFHRIGKGGKDVFIQALYNPIKGFNGEILSVIKYATDVTNAVVNRQRTATVAHSVASSVTQMTQTIQEISGNVCSTATLTKEAEGLAEQAKRGVQELDEQSRTINKIVETIRDLAEQTNLLALNATIESARAGEAGRGFSVVASEVKDLAKQTANATQSIETTVNQIQDSIQSVVQSTEMISKSVSNVSQNMTMISAAVEEQSVTMNSMADTAQELRGSE